jgi:hypothetical protein
VIVLFVSCMEYLIAKDFNEHRRVAKCENIYHILPL